MRIFGFVKKRPGEDNGIPRHIAIIMDGNGRWAKKRGLPRSAGHVQGAKTLKTITKYCSRIGVKYLTVFAFSTENWKRPKDEIDNIMNLFRTYLEDVIESNDGENVRIRFIGDIEPLADDIKEKIRLVHEKTANIDGLTLNVAVNYGGRAEIVNAMRRLAQMAKDGAVDPDKIGEADISAMLYTCSQPDPDIIIRPSGEMRISNFLLWQAAYSEFWYSNVLWPDFKPSHLDKAINDYRKRSRRFGGV